MDPWNLMPGKSRAEAHGLALVHYDVDFDAIAGVTGQPMRWLAPRGSL
jgi:hypothetical protein